MKCFRSNSDLCLVLFILAVNLVLSPGYSFAEIILSTFDQGKGSLSADIRISYRHEGYSEVMGTDRPNAGIGNTFRLLFDLVTTPFRSISAFGVGVTTEYPSWR